MKIFFSVLILFQKIPIEHQNLIFHFTHCHRSLHTNYPLICDLIYAGYPNFDIVTYSSVYLLVCSDFRNYLSLKKDYCHFKSLNFYLPYIARYYAFFDNLKIGYSMIHHNKH